ncbi:MAG: hypothetical protein LBJ12_02795 [Oscillospiraceae bacterium]|nr:hypothetical protein [Oscillospiraceae bacterium]
MSLTFLIPMLGKISAAIISLVQIALTVMSVPALSSSTPETPNPYLAPRTLISAHRLGSGLAPGNTLMAVEKTINSNNFNVDILEMDVQLTKDDELILLHNPVFDDTGNAVEAFGHVGVSPLLYNYKELHDKLNLGAKWDESWASLRGADIPDDLRVVKLEDVLAYAEANSNPQKPLYYTIEAKLLPANLGYKAADKIVEIANKLGIIDRILFGSFLPETAQYVGRKYPTLARTADPLEVLMFLDAFKNGDNLNKLSPRYKVLALPNGYGIDTMFKLADAKLVDYAHEYGIAVQYFTANDPDGTIAAKLADIGADAVIGDDVAAIYEKFE